MIRFIHCDIKFTKKLTALKNSDRKAKLAAQKANQVIDLLIEQANAQLVDLSCKTKHGEKRIKRCIKFDLGAGYRIVSVKNGYHLFLMYIGTHDECDRWIENNRQFTPEYSKNSLQILPTIKRKSESPVHTSQISSASDRPEHNDRQSIDQKTLRTIFQGLCQASEKA